MSANRQGGGSNVLTDASVNYASYFYYVLLAQTCLVYLVPLSKVIGLSTVHTFLLCYSCTPPQQISYFLLSRNCEHIKHSFSPCDSYVISCMYLVHYVHTIISTMYILHCYNLTQQSSVWTLTLFKFVLNAHEKKPPFLTL